MAKAGPLEQTPDGSKEKEEESGFVDLHKKTRICGPSQKTRICGPSQKTKFGDSQKNGGGSSGLSGQLDDDQFVEITVEEDGEGQPDRIERGTVTAAEIATVTEDDDPQSYEVNDVVDKMPQRAETCCNGIDFYNRCSTHILTEKQLQENSYPRPDPENIYTAKVYTPSCMEQYYKRAKLKPNEKICSRCSRHFRVNPDGTYVFNPDETYVCKKEVCFYHWGKELTKKNAAGYAERTYRSCCGRDVEEDECTYAKYHVHESNKWENLTGYQQTLPCPSVSDGDYGVYAMDTEMVYTQDGLELARVTVVDCNNEVAYDTFVRPDTKVIDYNTRFSGITAKDMDGVTTTIRDVQAVLLSLIAEETILIGHSLECDLTAVKVIHSKVVDTAVLFPDDRGPGFKPALKTLVDKYLEKTIQDDVRGHDSQEDAIACMKLMQLRVKDDALEEPQCG